MAANRKEADRLAIEGEYRAGVHSLRAIAEQYRITEGTIRKRAKQKGWLRDPGRHEVRHRQCSLRENR
jgi:hypothetical protein